MNSTSSLIGVVICYDNFESKPTWPKKPHLAKKRIAPHPKTHHFRFFIMSSRVASRSARRLSPSVQSPGSIRSEDEGDYSEDEEERDAGEQLQGGDEAPVAAVDPPEQKPKRVQKPRAPRPKLTLELLEVRCVMGL